MHVARLQRILADFVAHTQPPVEGGGGGGTLRNALYSLDEMICGRIGVTFVYYFVLRTYDSRGRRSATPKLGGKEN